MKKQNGLAKQFMGMQGICRIEQPEGIFRMTLLFQTVKE